MSEPRALMEHFFRHEFGPLVAVACLPEDPAGWLYRTARKLALDALRRERTRALAMRRMAEAPSGNRRR